MVGNDEKNTLALRRYILGLALVAFTRSASGYLRQGCILVLNPDQPREFVEVHSDGKRVPCIISCEAALDYATAAAKTFGVAESRTVDFDKERAIKDVKGEGDTKKTAKGRAKRSEPKPEQTEENHG